MESSGLQMDTVQFLLKIFATIKIAESSTRKQQDKCLHEKHKQICICMLYILFISNIIKLLSFINM